MINFLFDTNKNCILHFNVIFKFYVEQWNNYISIFTKPLVDSESRSIRNHVNVLRERMDHLEGIYYRTNGG